MSWAIWITGPPGSGKSAIARAVEAELRALGQPVKRLELDEVRKSITPAPRYTDAEREVVYRALGYMAALLVEVGRPVLIDATAHRRVWRDLVREAIPRFAEVQLVCPLEICRERERTRAPGHAPRDIYRKAGQPGATVPGVDVPYEVALAPELLIDTSAAALGEAVEQVVRLAGRLAIEAADAPAAAEGSGEPGWAIWITGRPGSGKSTLAMRVAEALRERGTRVRLLDLAPVQRFLLGGRPASLAEQDLVHRVLAYATKLLTEAGVSVIVDATAGRRVWREAARDLIPCFAEIQLLCPTEVCLERERAVRWGLTFETPRPQAATPGPDIVLDYEESVRPDLAIRTDVYDVQAATERVLFVIRRLAGSPSSEAARAEGGRSA
jgi:adenylylsulfate kinase